MKTRKWQAIAVWTTVLVLCVAMVAVITAGCGSDTDTSGTDSTETATSGGALDLTEADSGGTFTVGVGDTITVVIPGNPTTGYEWKSDLSEEAAALLELAGEPVYEADPVAEGIVGSGGKYTFTFTGAAAGEAELKLVYWRSFEPDVEPIDTFTATITIE